jgi:3'-phosphoadenosine 5'-phosphosulfate sulfotransferase (PAPS reductase)/FAD synthetase
VGGCGGSRYAHITKIEPTTRALDELQLEAWLTGRRRSQGAGLSLRG